MIRVDVVAAGAGGLTNLRARLRCDTELLEFTPSREVAQWSAQPIPIGRGEIRPLVVGPDGVPRVKSREAAARDPELAVLSAVAHGRDAVMVALPIAHAALDAVAQFPDERALLYSDLILAGLSHAARAAMEELMPGRYEYQSDFAIRHQALGRETALREVLARQLRVRFGRLDAETEARVAEALPADLDRLLERVVTAASLEEVFAP